MLCTIRNVTAAAAVALALSSCGSDEVAEVGDEQQIRDLIAAQMEAFSVGDWNALAELTCSEFQEVARDPGAFLVPPIDTFGSREQLATLSVPQVSEMLSEQFGGTVATPTLDRVSQALIDYDDPVYRSAMLDVITESTSLTVDRVDSIKITGDTGTADVTSTSVIGDKAPQTSTDSTPFVREGGVWRDCSDPTGS